MQKFHNSVEVVVKSGSTGEVEHRFQKDNSISDDLLVSLGRIFINDSVGNSGAQNAPFAFLLPDGADWTGFVWDRTNPYAPYTATLNNTLNNSVDALWKGRASLTNPSAATGNRWKMFFTWTQLPADLQLKAIGLTALQYDVYNSQSYGIPSNGVPCNFVPQALVVIPTSFLVHGAPPYGSTGVPDIVEVSYYLSVVGAS